MKIVTMDTKNNTNDVIDLTVSFCRGIPHSLTNTVIDLLDTTDESFNISADSDVCIEISRKQKHIKNKSNEKKRKSNENEIDKSPGPSESKRRRSSNILGDCPICWDRLGKNPICSTKCGHVYCLKCLEQSLKLEKKCPTCRRVLRGSSAYHPLYIN